MLVKVAVTGGLSCGKSSICRIFKELGAHVVSSDEIVHNLLMSPTTPLGQQVVALLGTDIIVNGQIDRSIIAKKVFNDRVLLQSLENIIHPAVFNEIDKQYQQLKDKDNLTFFVAEIPLLFETNGESHYDYTVVVETSKKLSQERFKATTGHENEEYERRMARQLPPEIKAARADFVINNNGNLSQLRQATVALNNFILLST